MNPFEQAIQDSLASARQDGPLDILAPENEWLYSVLKKSYPGLSDDMLRSLLEGLQGMNLRGNRLPPAAPGMARMPPNIPNMPQYKHPTRQGMPLRNAPPQQQQPVNPGQALQLKGLGWY